MNSDIASDSGLHWNQSYVDGKHTEDRNKPSDFVITISKQLKTEDNVLELGCGVGIDAVYLAERVNSVTAVDFAESQIESNRANFSLPNLTFETVDISHGLGQFKDAEFSAVYARRSLHYFDEDTTKFVFREIQRVLQPDGKLFFECKSINDPRATQVAKQGDVRHFFSVDELPKLLPGFVTEHMAEKPAPDFYGFDSVFLRCWARKNTN